jgi:hypothetical protein
MEEHTARLRDVDVGMNVKGGKKEVFALRKIHVPPLET